MATTKRNLSSRRNRKVANIPLYALISLGVFLCCLVLLSLLVFNARTLTGLGLAEHVYYLVLVLMGLTAAGFLFGVLPSTATYDGSVFRGSLKLGGASVGAALVVIGGYMFIPKAFAFPLTVFIHGPGGPQDVVLQNSGHVALELGPEVKRAAITENGEAHFAAIPVNFRGQEVPAWVESDTYESVQSQTTKYRLDSSSLYLIVQKKIRHYSLAGTVTDIAGNPLPNVRVAVPEYNISAQTNQDGRFTCDIVADNQRTVTLSAQKTGYQTQRLIATLGDSGVNFSLQR